MKYGQWIVICGALCLNVPACSPAGTQSEPAVLRYRREDSLAALRLALRLDTTYIAADTGSCPVMIPDSLVPPALGRPFRPAAPPASPAVLPDSQ